MELVSVLDITIYTKLEAEYMRTGNRYPGLEHCFGLMWKILGGGGKDVSERMDFCDSKSQL